MKYILPILFVLTACVSQPSQAPGVCRRNLQDCFSAFEGQTETSRQQWEQACRADFDNCKSRWGTR